MKNCPSCALANADDAAFCINCGASLPRFVQGMTARLDEGAPPSALPASRLDPYGHLTPGTVVDAKYAIERVLGEGGMGVVYLARDVHTETNVVVKSIRAEFAHNAEFRARILAEGRALARIDHPNVVRLNAIALERGELYLVMQFIEGESLDRTIARHVSEGRPIPFAEALRIFRMILAGVGAAHAEGVIHRDLKPANILLRARDGVAKVTDFGIAKGEEDAKAGRGQTLGIIGSLSYMAPEQVRGARDLDKRVDIYALGILFFELLVGRVPFDAPTDFELMKLHTEAPLPPLRARRPDLPAFLDEILARACAKDRSQRISDTTQFLQALDGATEAHTARASAASLVVPNAATQPQTAPELPGRWSTATATATAEPSRAGDGATHAGTALPSLVPGRGRSRVALFVGLGLGLLAAFAAAIYVSQSIDGSPAAPVASGGPARTDASVASSATAAPSASTGTPPALAQLAGPWKSDSDRDYDAVLWDDVLEFRIVHAAQHPRQGYRDGEARFALRAVAGDARSFTVEDRIRPIPPKGFEYDGTRSRATCQATWSTIGDRPLYARFDGKTLAVELAKIETTLSRFVTEGTTIVGCERLRDAPAEKIGSMLTRAARGAPGAR